MNASTKNRLTSENHKTTKLQVAWCGSARHGLSWLRSRVQTSCELVGAADQLSRVSADELCNARPHRLIVACESRLDYPADLLLHLRQSWPEIPLAVATESWFEGSQRTGIGKVSHSMHPWHRWWDAWQPWLCEGGLQPEQFAPNSTKQTKGLIVSNCIQTAQGWLRSSGAQAICLRCTELFCTDSPSQANIDWILWDDSSLETSRQTVAGERATQLESITGLRKQHPKALLIVASSMPRGSEFAELESLGIQEFLTKPSWGQSLRRLLANYQF